VADRAAAQREVWQPWSVGKVSKDDYARLMRLPGYERDLDVVAVAPDGVIAAYVNGWTDPLNRIGDFGPVGARSAYRRSQVTARRPEEHSMKITAVQTVPVDYYLFVKVHTDAGLTGLGESGAWGYLEASAQAVEKFAQYLVGQDPLRIEHHWQALYRWSHFRGAAIMGALSAIDIALWDIAGKHFGVPCYQLLGGACRHKARVYGHVFGATTEELVQGCRRARKQGFTAIGHLTPFLDEEPDLPYFETHAGKMRRAIDRVRQYREAVGDEVDLCIEIHRRLSAAEAIVLAQGIAPYHPFFYEDPVLPDNFDEMALVAQHSSIPIATGERLHTHHL
jgi:galactonate dehydratase